MKVTGKLIEIKETQQVSESFKKRSFVIEYAENPQYPEYVSFELIQDKCELMDSFQLGQVAEVSFNLRGRKWLSPEGDTRYFNSLQAWRVEGATQDGSKSSSDTGSSSNKNSKKDEEDDLPF